jgi:hypothetical protein
MYGISAVFLPHKGCLNMGEIRNNHIILVGKHKWYRSRKESMGGGENCLFIKIKNQDQLDAQSLLKSLIAVLTFNSTCFGQIPDHLQGYTTLKCYVHM